MQKVDTIEHFQQLTIDNNQFIFFKNSMTCPISSNAFSQFEQFTKEYPKVPAYYLNVQQSRALSNYIAETYGIKHESPQIILFKNNEAKWHTSHWNITKEAIEKHVL